MRKRYILGLTVVSFYGFKGMSSIKRPSFIEKFNAEPENQAVSGKIFRLHPHFGVFIYYEKSLD